MQFSRQLCSLYRSYLRQVGKLPHLYLRQFFQIRARQDVQALFHAKSDTQCEQRIESLYRRIRRIEKANNRDRKAFLHILDLAYGRIGKLKWELLEICQPILTDPSSPMPTPIIQSLEKSRPPVYSPELKTLLTHPSSKRNKVLRPEDFSSPRTLPARADPNSEEARIFGRFSKRREVNIRWRFYKDELKKVFPPLEVELIENIDDKQEDRISLRPLRMSGHGNLVERLVGDIFPRPPLTRRERRTSGDSDSSHFAVGEGHPSRWIRRRHRTLLAQLPHLTYDARKGDPFKVNTSPLALLDPHRYTRQIPDVDPVTAQWLEQLSTDVSKGSKRRDLDP